MAWGKEKLGRWEGGGGGKNNHANSHAFLYKYRTTQQPLDRNGFIFRGEKCHFRFASLFLLKYCTKFSYHVSLMESLVAAFQEIDLWEVEGWVVVFVHLPVLAAQKSVSEK